MDEEEKKDFEPQPHDEPGAGVPTPAPQPNSEPPSEEPAPEPTPTPPTYAEALEAIRQDMEQRVEEVRAAAERDIKERDDIIRQLMSGRADTPPPDMPRTVADSINARRQYTKW